MTTTIPGYCTLCRSRCGTLNEVDREMLIAVRPDPSHPTGQAMCMKGHAAPEIVHSPHRQLYPLKRTTPKGSAGPGWQRITWEEALSETARRLGEIKAESGAEAVAFAITSPSGTPLSDSIDWIERFIRHFGSPNICFATEICNWHKDFAHAFTFGCAMPTADYENADTILLWGHNPANTWLAQAHAIGRGRKKGAAMVVVDPRPIALAHQADVWLPVRPGTDAALALGLIRMLIETRRYDEDFVRRWTNGPFLVRTDNGTLLRARDLLPGDETERYIVWDEQAGCPIAIDPGAVRSSIDPQRLALRGTFTVTLEADGQRVDIGCMPAFEHLTREAEPYDALHVQAVTNVPPEALRAAADLLCGGRRIAYHAWSGLAQHTNATQADRAVATLYALSGSFDRIGGNRIRRSPPYNPVNAFGYIPKEQMAKALGISERPIGPPAMGWVTARDLYRAVSEGVPYKVRGMMAFGTNLSLSQADSRTAEAALKALEFHVHCDLFETPAARNADIFLPVNSPWEHEGLRIGFEISAAAASLIQLRPRMVAPRGQSRSDNDIVFDLASRLGMGDAFFGGSLEAGWNHMLAPLGLTVDELRAAPRGLRWPVDAPERKFALTLADDPEKIRGFDTETRRVELYSERLHRCGQPAIASYVPPAERTGPDNIRRGRKYPLILSSAKNGLYCHSQHRSLASLRKRAPEPIAEISPALSAARGIAEGDGIRISTREGQARFITRVTPGLADDIVVAEFGWWQACPELDRPALAIEGGEGSNFNSLISGDASDPVSGSTPLRSFLCDIEPDPLSQKGQRRWQGYLPFRVSALQADAEGVMRVCLTAVNGEALPDFHPGQHVEIRARIGSAVVSRAYSLIDAARVDQRQTYNITVRLRNVVLEDSTAVFGVMSNHIHTELAVGEIVELKSPSGSFVLPRQSPQPMILMASGIGITPFMSLLESLPDGDPAEIWLHYGNTNSRTHAFSERIAFHEQRLPGLTVVNYYSKPLATDRRGVNHQATGRISATVVADDLIARRARVYMCGSAPMMEDVRTGLVARGLPAFDIFSEAFTSPATAMVDDGKTFRVSFSLSRKQPDTWSPASGPLLSFGEALGVNLPSGCRVGQCESCEVRILSGNVRHLHGSEPDDHTVCLTCQAVPITDIVLDA